MPTRKDPLAPDALAGDAFWAFARAALRNRAVVLGTLCCAILSSACLGFGIVGVKPILEGMLTKHLNLPGIAQGFNASLAHKAQGSLAFLSRLQFPQSLIDALPTDPFKGLALVMGGLMILTCIGATATFAHQYLSLSIVNRTIAAIRQRAFRAVLRAPLRDAQKLGAADAMSRIVKDSDTLSGGLNVLVSKTVIQACKGIAAFVAAFVLDWRVCLTALLIVPLLYTIIRRLGKRIRKASASQMEGQAALLGTAGESLQALRTVKNFGAEVHESGKFGSINKLVLREANRVRSARALAGPLTDTLTLAMLSGIALIAAKAILTGKVLPADFILAMIALVTAMASFKPLASLAHDIQTSRPAADRLRELLLLPAESTRGETSRAPSHTSPFPRHARDIVFRNVSLTHPGRDAPALRNISLAVRHGERVAFVGPNGCGKTTLVSLLTRLYPPDAGTIAIDGVDIAGVPLRRLRAQIGVVSQETVLFKGTIRENIAFGRSASDREILAAATRARAHEFVAGLPEGYDTPVAEQGSSLSGGQRQRLAIARAFLGNPAILILDEATSMIDPESEARIAEAIKEFGVGRTCLIVAHRFATVVDCNRIVVMEAGEIVDVGTHEQLLARCPLYRTLAQHTPRGEVA